jgi:endo-cleaving rubber dioxygenase
VQHFEKAASVMALAVLLSACTGDYSGLGGKNGDDNGDGGDNGSGSFANVEEYFTARVQPRLEYCRTCHVPGGVADVADGRAFALSGNRAQDFESLKASWTVLGGNDPVSRILTMASGQEKPHSGGAPWLVEGTAYQDVARLLLCFGDAAACAELTGGGALPPELPLLGSKRALHAWNAFCEDKPDDAELPVDPRRLVRPGANDDRAVYFNAFWEDCRTNLPVDQQHATTCGEYRARRDRGLGFLLDDLAGTGGSAASGHNNTWQKWGESTRPEQFDRMYTLRYGMNQAPFHNPYPLPGEDPNATGGGSGQLPLGLRQVKDGQGRWTGRIAGTACFLCHGGQVGDPYAGETAILTLENLGLGNANYDVLAGARDGSPFAGTPLSEALPALDFNSLFNMGIKQRGQNNAVGAFELLVTILDLDSLGMNPNPLKFLTADPPDSIADYPHPLAHTQDTPAWWNYGSRPRKFFDAGVSNDSTRIIMAAGPGDFNLLFSPNGKPYRDRIKAYDVDLATFFLSLRSPPYPGEIDEALAEQGAVLFHTKDLWAYPGNAEHPRPLGGNGSCSSCHGAYAPRFVNDPAWLETPDLEGVAAHIAPLAVIGTDRARSDMLTPTLRRGWGKTYWGYPDGLEGWTDPDQKNPMVEFMDDMLPRTVTGLCTWEQGVIGYQAPPLYGVWATAPYFHNGSVPTLEQVLDSSKRPALWRRKLETIGSVTGFDQSLARAYDHDAVGWKHDVLSCADIPGTELYNCNPVIEEGPSLVQISQNLLNQIFPYAGVALIPDPAPDAFDKRFVFDSRILGNDNGGHTFSDVLTDLERRAIIEYLKTL